MDTIMKIHRYEVRGVITELELEYKDKPGIVSIMAITENIKHLLPLHKGRLVFVEINENNQVFSIKRYVNGKE